MSENTKEKFKTGIAFDALQAVGHGLGIHTTRPAIKTRVAKKFHFVDQLMQVAFGPRLSGSAKNKRLIELSGLGVIAGYSLYKGIKRNNAALLIEGLFFSATLATVALGSSRWFKSRRTPLLANRLYREKYVFDIKTETGVKSVEIENLGESFSVKINGEKKGFLWRDLNKNPEWNTPNEALKPHMKEILHHLSHIFTRKEFPAIVKGNYPEVVAARWLDTGQLKVVVADHADFEVFKTFFEDEIHNLVTFDASFPIILTNQNRTQNVLLQVN